MGGWGVVVYRCAALRPSDTPTPILFFSLFRNQQSEYLCALWADVLAVSRGEVPSSEEISVVDSINCWLMYGSSKWGFDLKSNSTNYPNHGHHGDPPLTRKNPHGRAGNRTRDLVICSQKLWPIDREAIWHRFFRKQTNPRSSFITPQLSLRVVTFPEDRQTSQ